MRSKEKVSLTNQIIRNYKGKGDWSSYIRRTHNN